MTTAAVAFNPFTPNAIRSADSSLLKAMLDDPVQFREAPALVGTVDPAGKGWLEVNPLPGSSGAKAKAAGKQQQQQGAKAHSHAREQPVASSSTTTTSGAGPTAGTAKGKGKVIYPTRIALDFPAQKQRIGSGLHNTGNSCYANSVLQAVIHTPGFANYVYDGSHRPNGVCAVAKSKKHDGHCQHCAMRMVIHNSFQLGKTAYTPTVITNNLKKIGKTLRKGRQEDAHEFLRFLIDGLQNAALFPYGDPNKLPAEFKYTTGIHQLFGGQLRSRVACSRCKHNSDTFDAFLDLSIEVRGCRSIKAGFDKFVKPDVLDGQNKYKCEKCNKLVVASKGLSITQAPQALMVQLRRFTPTGGKLNDAVAYDRTFDISPYMAEGSAGARYSLYAVVCHSGSGPHSGHYTSRVLSTDGKSWHMMDDSSVYPLNGGGSQPPLNLREAYLLMYVREKGAALEEAIRAAGPMKMKKQQQQQAQVVAAPGTMPSPAPSSSAAHQALAAAAVATTTASAGPNGNKKRRISQIPAEADRSLPSPPATSDDDEEDEAEYDTTLGRDDDEVESSDEDEEDVGRPAKVITSGPLRLNAPLIARSNKKARREGQQLLTPTPSATTSAATSASSSNSSDPTSSSTSAVPLQGLGPRPFGFGSERKDASTPHNQQRRRRDGSGPGGSGHSKKHGGHRGGHHRAIKDPYGLSLAGKGGHKLKKGLVKRMGGRP